MIDQAIAKKGHGRKKCVQKGKRNHVSREEEEEVMRSYGKWNGRKGRAYSESDTSDP